MGTYSNITHWLTNNVSKIMKDIWASKEYPAILILILTLWALTKVDPQEEITRMKSKKQPFSAIETSLSTVLAAENPSKLNQHTIPADTIDVIVENNIDSSSSWKVQDTTLFAQRE